MKEIINHKVYNTDTAEEICSWNDGDGFRFYKEILYKTKKGNYFVFGEGGPASKYAVTCGLNCWSGSSKITPMTYDEAEAWAENKMDVDDFIDHFGEVEEA